MLLCRWQAPRCQQDDGWTSRRLMVINRSRARSIRPNERGERQKAKKRTSRRNPKMELKTETETLRGSGDNSHRQSQRWNVLSFCVKSHPSIMRDVGLFFKWTYMALVFGCAWPSFPLPFSHRILQIFQVRNVMQIVQIPLCHKLIMQQQFPFENYIQYVYILCYQLIISIDANLGPRLTSDLGKANSFHFVVSLPHIAATALYDIRYLLSLSEEVSLVASHRISDTSHPAYSAASSTRLKCDPIVSRLSAGILGQQQVQDQQLRNFIPSWLLDLYNLPLEK